MCWCWKPLFAEVKDGTAVRADLDAFALRSNDNFLRVLLVNDQCVDDPVARGHTFEILVIHGLP